MSKLSFENTQDWKSASKEILSLPEIRFIGVVNNMGNLIVGDYKRGVVPIAEIEQYKMCMEHALELFMKKDLDDTLGSLDYIVSKRKKMAIITVPVNNYLVLISVEPNAKIEPIIVDILQKLKSTQ
ncbi:MAG TPA: DUF6659 family protein [Nitrosopumilaceae archaeon]|nr:DUF6659 family protein [Nitrosopumilaceae archaeon]